MSTTLKKLEFSSGGLAASSIRPLAQALRHNVSIKTLVIEQCDGIGDSGLAMLFAEGLFQSISLTHLTLQDCAITDRGVSLLAEHWPTDSLIQHLSLRNNLIGADGMRSLLQAVRDHGAIRSLDVGGNSISYEGLQMLGEELANLQFHLTHIELDDCFTWTHHKDALSDLALAQDRARSQAQESLLEGIRRNWGIHRLGVDRNGFDSSIECSVKWYAGLNRNGRDILCSHHEFAPTIWCHVLSRCQAEQELGASLMFYHLKEQPALVQTSRLSTVS